MDNKKIMEDLAAERLRVNEWLMEKRVFKFGSIGDKPFEEKSGVGRGQCPGIRNKTASPSLDSMFLWARACDRDLSELFHGQPVFIPGRHLRIHEKMQHLIEHFGMEHWAIKAIESAYVSDGPKTHGHAGRKREVTEEPKKKIRHA